MRLPWQVDRVRRAVRFLDGRKFLRVGMSWSQSRQRSDWQAADNTRRGLCDLVEKQDLTSYPQSNFASLQFSANFLGVKTSVQTFSSRLVFTRFRTVQTDSENYFGNCPTNCIHRTCNCPTMEGIIHASGKRTLTNKPEKRIMYTVNYADSSFQTNSSLAAARVFVAQLRNGRKPSVYAKVVVGDAVSIRPVYDWSNNVKKMQKLIAEATAPKSGTTAT